jgi:gamma-glutamyltranspeptidase / glutathione hydrolase
MSYSRKPLPGTIPGRCLAAGLLALLGACAAPRAPVVAAGAGGVFPHAAVAADHEAASRAGVEVLRQGGNAVDAAVATSFALSVVRPYSCGIGGGGFMVIRFTDDPRFGTRDIALNYREVAPAGVGPGFYEDGSRSSTRGGAAVAVPGTVAGLLYALEHYGTMDRRAVLAPAIRLAERGFIADEHYVDSARALARQFEQNAEYKSRFRFVWERFLREGRVNVGDRIRLPEQAQALRLIAERGAGAFYDGPIGEAIVAAVQRDGGVLTAEDLAGYRVDEGEPLTFAFRGRTFLAMPPPSSGGLAMAQVFGILERKRVWAHRDDEAAYVHILAEAFKHAFADRSRWLGDPAFVDVPVDRLMSPGYLDELAGRVDPERALEPGRYGTELPEEDPSHPRRDGEQRGGTSHFSVVDGWGNAVSCTETINLTFGSLLAVDRYGFCLNNEMDDFTTVPGQVNAFGLRQSELNLPAPGKRPLSSMSPTIVLDADGSVRMASGASGGPRIITSTTQVILAGLGDRAPLGETTAPSPARGRIHHQWAPDVLSVERERYRAWSPSVLEALRRRGHEVRPVDAVGNAQAIRRVEGGWEAVSDPRKGGAPAGY